MYLYGHNTKEANMIKDYFKMMEFNGDTDSFKINSTNS